MQKNYYKQIQTKLPLWKRFWDRLTEPLVGEDPEIEEKIQFTMKDYVTLMESYLETHPYSEKTLRTYEDQINNIDESDPVARERKRDLSTYSLSARFG
ncbi:MAG: hypothetical protein R2877_06430 [Bdellovibrionota bacterium]